ncbi:43543_t:CDS:2, partial [Gigaspora margarita]
MVKIIEEVDVNHTEYTNTSKDTSMKLCNDNQKIEIYNVSVIDIQQILIKELFYLVGELKNMVEL